MAGDSNEGIKVVTGKGSTSTKPVSGVETAEGQVMLVNDVGREGFAAPSHPTITVTATASPFLQLIKTAIGGANTGWGMSAGTDVPTDIVAKRGFLFKADAANTTTIFIGTSAVSSSAGSTFGMPLAAGESLFVEVTRASSFYMETDSGTPKLHFLAI